MSRPTDRGAVTTPVLLAAAVLASPALFRSLVQDLVPLSVALQRFVLITLGCVAVAYVVQRLLPSSAPADGAEVGGGAGGSDAEAVSTPAASSAGDDLLALDVPATSLLDGLDDLDADLFDTDLLDSAQLALGPH